MILSKDEVDFYNEKGYLLVEDVITEDQHNEMLRLVKDFFEKSKNVKKNDNIFDLEDGHSSTNPRLKRVKQPHQHSKFFWDIIKQSKIEGILIDLLGKDISLKTTVSPGEIKFGFSVFDLSNISFGVFPIIFHPPGLSKV